MLSKTAMLSPLAVITGLYLMADVDRVGVGELNPALAVQSREYQVHPMRPSRPKHSPKRSAKTKPKSAAQPLQVAHTMRHPQRTSPENPAPMRFAFTSANPSSETRKLTPPSAPFPARKLPAPGSRGIIARYDRNADGALDFEEFSRAQLSRFHRYDRNASGIIDTQEITRGTGSLLALTGRRRLLQSLDANRDFRVDLQEYKAVIRHRFDRYDSDGDGRITHKD